MVINTLAAVEFGPTRHGESPQRCKSTKDPSFPLSRARSEEIYRLWQVGLVFVARTFFDYGPIFTLSFGPKSFLVVSDPVMALTS
jgi:hypothetical protein